MYQFNYERPKTLADAESLLGKADDPKILAASSREPKTACIAWFMKSSPMLKNLLESSSPGLVTTPTISRWNS